MPVAFSVCDLDFDGANLLLLLLNNKMQVNYIIDTYVNLVDFKFIHLNSMSIQRLR